MTFWRLYETLRAAECIWVVDRTLPGLNRRGERVLRYLEARRRRV